MIAEHFAALKTLADGGDLAGRVHEAALETTDGTLVRDQYVILWPVVPDLEPGRYTEAVSIAAPAEYEWDVRAVGIDADMASKTMDALLARLIGQRLTVAGRACTPLTVGISGGRPAPDQSVKPFLYYVDASVSCTSRPAA